MLIKEYCAENFTTIPQAIAAGVQRIELCDNLSVGGTTVSSGVLKQTIAYCHEENVTVMAIIRPRGGNFVYNDTELKIMVNDLQHAKELGVDGVVIGCLTADNQLDEEAMLTLLKIADGLQVTFHMAFDQLAKEDQFQAIDWLAAHGVQRVLTHGGLATSDIKANLVHLKKLMAHSHNRLTILPGGGISHLNYQSIVDTLAVAEIHGTKIVNI